MKYLYILFFILIVLPIKTQNDRIKKIETLITQSKFFKRSNIDSAKILNDSTLSFFNNYKNDSLYAEALRIKGTLWNRSNLDSAEYYFNKSLKHAILSKRKTSIIAVKSNLALLANDHGNFEKSDSLFKILISEVQEIKNVRTKLAIHINSVNNKIDLGRYSEAVMLSDIAFAIAAENDFHTFDYILNSQAANLYFKLGDFEASLKNYRLCLESLKTRDRRSIPIFNNIASCLTKLDSFESAKIYLDSVFLLNPDNSSLFTTYHTMSNVNIHFKDFVKAQENIDSITILGNNYDNSAWKCMAKTQQAMLYVESGQIHKFDSISDECLQCLSNVGRSRQSLDFLKTILQTSSTGRMKKLINNYFIGDDSLNQKSNDRKIIELEIESHIFKQKAENELLANDKLLAEARIARQKTLLIWGAITLGLISLISYLLYKLYIKSKNLNQRLRSQRDQIKLLNREINHRVKNNLAFMSSLIEMQGRRTDFDETKQALRESETRLKALSLVHVNLFKDENDTEVNLKPYLEEIIIHLIEIFETPEKEIKAEFDFIPYALDAESAMRVGLILNELITNSVKHAFDDEDCPKIYVETYLENGKLVLRYRDNGPGIKEKVLTESKETDSMGIKLISLLKQQLEKDVIVQFE